MLLPAVLTGPCGRGDLEQIQSAFKTDASAFQTISSKVNVCQRGFRFLSEKISYFLMSQTKLLF